SPSCEWPISATRHPTSACSTPCIESVAGQRGPWARYFVVRIAPFFDGLPRGPDLRRARLDTDRVLLPRHHRVRRCVPGSRLHRHGVATGDLRNQTRIERGACRLPRTRCIQARKAPPAGFLPRILSDRRSSGCPPGRAFGTVAPPASTN